MNLRKNMSWCKLSVFCLFAMLLAACTAVEKKSTVTQKEPPITTVTVSESSVSSLINRANAVQYPERGELLLQAVDRLLIEQNIAYAEELLSGIDRNGLTYDAKNHYNLVNAALALYRVEISEARTWLAKLNPKRLSVRQQLAYYDLMANASELESRYSETLENLLAAANIDTLSYQNKQQIYDKLWAFMLRIPQGQLAQMVKSKNELSAQAWLELAYIFKASFDVNKQLENLERWSSKWKDQDAFEFMPEDIKILQTTRLFSPKKIALLLPLTGSLSKAGQTVRDGFIAASIYDSNHRDPSDIPEILVYDTSKNVSLGNLVTLAEESGVELIVGPLSRDKVQECMKSCRARVPQLLLNMPLDGTLEHTGMSPLYFLSLSAEQEAAQAALRAWEDGFRRPIVISPDTDWGIRVANSFRQQWLELGGSVLDSASYNTEDNPNDIASTLLHVNKNAARRSRMGSLLNKSLKQVPRRRQDLDVIFMATTPAFGRQLKPSLNYYFAYDIPVYSTTSIYEGLPDSMRDRDLTDIRFPIMPWFTRKKDALSTNTNVLWKENFGSYGTLYALGIDAWHIYPRLEQLSRAPEARIYGETGVLSVDKRGVVHRDLEWSYFDDGVPKPLTRGLSHKKEKVYGVVENTN